MAKNKVIIPRGIASRNGKPVTDAEDFLNASCDCGIDCCYGLIKLPNYNSISGDSETYGMYVVDGEFVYEPLAEAIENIKAFKANPVVSATSVVITNCEPSSVIVVGGATKQLTRTVLPAGASQAGTWTSSAPLIATVSVGGLVTAVAAGTSTITFTSTDGGFTATCVVTVEEE